MIVNVFFMKYVHSACFTKATAIFVFRKYIIHWHVSKVESTK